MNWVKTYFEIEADKKTISLLTQQLMVNGVFTIHRMYHIPKRLLVTSNKLVTEIIVFLNYLEDNNFGVLEFTLRDFFRDEVIEFLESNELSSLTKMVSKDLKLKGLHLDTTFTKYLEIYKKNVAGKVIKLMRNFKETGYYDAFSFYMANIGAGSHPVDTLVNITDTSIKGHFLTSVSCPILFFEYLRDTYDVKLNVSFLDIETGEFIELTPELTIMD